MAKTPRRKPSFEPPADSGATPSADWVYRSGDAASNPEKKPRAKAARTGGATRTRAPKPSAEASTAAKGETKPSAETAAPAGADAPGTGDRLAGAHLVVGRYAKYAAGAAFLPMIAIDLAAIAGVQVAMLSALSKHYDVPFQRERGKAVVSALLGSLMPTLAGYQAMKVVGTILGMASLSAFAFAATTAVGRAFAAHFESGGTLLDVDIEQTRTQVADQLKGA